jgi:serine/threonine protein kinase
MPEAPSTSEANAHAVQQPNSHPVADDQSSLGREHAAKFLSDRDFVLEMHIGTGGTGRVYRARRKSDDHLVAINILRKASQRDPAAVARFLDEAQMVAQLNHPGIVAVQGIGCTRNGGYFLVQELVRGNNLAERAREQSILVTEASLWVAAAAEALHHAHSRGIVHCDLKPANLLLDSSGRVRVTDFGFAQIITPGSASRSAIAGTFGYMAPEQLDSSWGVIGPHTDVFGLGAVLYSLLAARPPFSGSSIDELFRSMLETAPVPLLQKSRLDVPLEFGVVLSRCLALNPRERFQTASDVASAFRYFHRS